jgi:hypothetical protein
LTALQVQQLYENRMLKNPEPARTADAAIAAMSIPFGMASMFTVTGGIPPYTWAIDTIPTSSNYTLTPGGTGNVNADLTIRKKSGVAVVTATDATGYTKTENKAVGSGGTTIIVQ